jgi:actin-related protein 10
VTLVPSAIAALYATGHHTALVVDCGYSETRLLPVYKGIPLLYFFSSASAFGDGLAMEVSKRNHKFDVTRCRSRCGLVL